MYKKIAVVAVVVSVAFSLTAEAAFIQPNSVSASSEFNGNFVAGNLFDEAVTAGTDTISASDSHVGSAYASGTGLHTATVTLDFTAKQELNAFYLWNMAGANNGAVPPRGIKQFDLLFFDGAAGTGNSLGVINDLSATQSPISGTYTAQIYSFAAIAGVQSVQLVIDTNFEYDDTGSTSFVGAREVGFEAIPEPATLGMVALFGGGILFIRRKLAI